MRRDLAEALIRKAEEIAQKFSNPFREFNGNKETFIVSNITPLSEATAVVEFNKTPGKKKAIAFLYWVKGNGGFWGYFFPAESHVFGMQKLAGHLQRIEEHNFAYNFEEKKLEEFV
jgi:hypothetical protein